jgi:hypothetical protein
MRQVCLWNRTLARESARLRDELACVRREGLGLQRDNADLRVQLVVCDRMLGAAMDLPLTAQ